LLVRPEEAADVPAIRAVTSAAFASAPHSAPPVDASGEPGEATLVGWLREDEGWIPALSLVAVLDGELVGHAVCTRGYVDSTPALGLGPVSVRPERQRSGVGTALITALLGAADAQGESLVALLGDPAYYGRFGFRPAAELGIEAPDPAWGAYFQARPLAANRPVTGRFRYAAPFDRL